MSCNFDFTELQNLVKKDIETLFKQINSAKNFSDLCNEVNYTSIFLGGMQRMIMYMRMTGFITKGHDDEIEIEIQKKIDEAYMILKNYKPGNQEVTEPEKNPGINVG